MGAIILAYNMVGYNEIDRTLYKYPKALVLQTINSLRAADFPISLPEVNLKGTIIKKSPLPEQAINKLLTEYWHVIFYIKTYYLYTN